MVKWGIHEVKCREYAGSVTAQRVTAVFIFLRICLSDLKPREKAKSPRLQPPITTVTCIGSVWLQPTQ